MKLQNIVKVLSVGTMAFVMGGCGGSDSYALDQVEEGGSYGSYAANLLVGKTFYSNECHLNTRTSYSFTEETMTQTYIFNPGLGDIYGDIGPDPVEYEENKFIPSTMYYEGYLYDFEYCKVEASSDHQSVLVSCKLYSAGVTVAHFTMWRNIEDADNNPEEC